MKALLMSSPGISEPQVQELQKLIGKSKAVRALFIIAAAVPYGLNPYPLWLVESLSSLREYSIQVDETSLEHESDFPGDLTKYDFIFVSGGNVSYLAYQLTKSGLDKKLIEYCKNGGVYLGSSAGSIILMDDITHFVTNEDLAKVPKIYPGLGLIAHALVPHVDNKKHQNLMKEIMNKYQTSGYSVIGLNDYQALIINDNESKIV